MADKLVEDSSLRDFFRSFLVRPSKQCLLDRPYPHASWGTQKAYLCSQHIMFCLRSTFLCSSPLKSIIIIFFQCWSQEQNVDTRNIKKKMCLILQYLVESFYVLGTFIFKQSFYKVTQDTFKPEIPIFLDQCVFTTFWEYVGSRQKCLENVACFTQ